MRDGYGPCKLFLSWSLGFPKVVLLIALLLLRLWKEISESKVQYGRKGRPRGVSNGYAAEVVALFVKVADHYSAVGLQSDAVAYAALLKGWPA